jgi:hypothetical protein
MFSRFSKVQLEEIRNSENQLRWQPEEDYPECQRCHSQFTVTWRKHHCRKFYLIFNSLILVFFFYLGHCGKLNFEEFHNEDFSFNQVKSFVKIVLTKMFILVHIIAHLVYVMYVIPYLSKILNHIFIHLCPMFNIRRQA